MQAEDPTALRRGGRTGSRSGLRPALARRRACSRTRWLALIAGALTVFPSVAAHAGSETRSVPEPNGTASDLPLWEVGVGGGFGVAPIYPAADRQQLRGAGLPWVLYRGRILRVGRGGVRAVAMEGPRLRLDLSLSGAFPASSDKSPRRAGMEDLDALVGIGPRISWAVPVGSPLPGRTRVAIRGKARAVLSVDLRRIRDRGFVFGPELSLDHRFPRSRASLGLSISPEFATGRLHAYFYGVNPVDARPERPVWQAQGGYLGTDIRIRGSLSLYGKRVRLFAGGRVGLHQGAANRNSPLFARETTFAAAMGMLIRFWSSEARARGRMNP